MRTKITNVKDFNDVSLEMVMNHTRVDDGYDAELLQSYLSASIDLAGKYTNRALTERTVQAYLPVAQSVIRLPYGSVSAINNVTGVNRDGDEVSIEFTFNDISESISLSDTDYTDVKIEYECGYPEGEVPKGIVQGILMLTGTLYNTREDISFGVTAYKVPFTSKALLDAYRIIPVGE